MMIARSFLVVLVLLGVSSSSALAGVVQSLSPSKGSQKLRWSDRSVHLSISKSMLSGALNIKYGSDVEGAIRRSLEAWERVADISFIEEYSDELSLSPSGLSGDGSNLITIAPTAANVLLFGKNDESSAAKTRVFYNRLGFITEADIVLSPFQQFSTDGTLGTFDLQATLTHEIGHLLGLRHSTVIGSMMYGNSSRNGVFGESLNQTRTISDDDLSAVRELYGFAKDDSCCGSLAGRLTSSTKSSRGAEVWLRDQISGKIVGHATASKDGNFTIGGLSAGTYSLQARDTGMSLEYSVVDLGSVSVSKGEVATFNRRLPSRTRDFSLEYIGKNGVLSDSPLRLERGNTYTIYVGGRNLSSTRLHLDPDSPFLVFGDGSLADQAYDGGISGLSFTIEVSDEAPNGNYSICLSTAAGTRDCFVGAVSIADRDKP